MRRAHPRPTLSARAARRGASPPTGAKRSATPAWTCQHSKTRAGNRRVSRARSALPASTRLRFVTGTRTFSAAIVPKATSAKAPGRLSAPAAAWERLPTRVVWPAALLARRDMSKPGKAEKPAASALQGATRICGLFAKTATPTLLHPGRGWAAARSVLPRGTKTVMARVCASPAARVVVRRAKAC